MVSATRTPNILATSKRAIGSIGMFRVVDRSITPSAHYLASSGIGSARLQMSCSPCLADLLNGTNCRSRLGIGGVALARDHQLPRDAGCLVGECYSGQLWRLAREKFDE